MIVVVLPIPTANIVVILLVLLAVIVRRRGLIVSTATTWHILIHIGWRLSLLVVRDTKESFLLRCISHFNLALILILIVEAHIVLLRHGVVVLLRLNELDLYRVFLFNVVVVVATIILLIYGWSHWSRDHLHLIQVLLNFLNVLLYVEAIIIESHADFIVCYLVLIDYAVLHQEGKVKDEGGCRH
jgi:hypothetical protein